MVLLLELKLMFNLIGMLHQVMLIYLINQLFHLVIKLLIGQLKMQELLMLLIIQILLTPLVMED